MPPASSVSSSSGGYSASFKSDWLVPSTPSPASSQIGDRTATSTPVPSSTAPPSLNTSRTSDSSQTVRENSFNSTTSSNTKYAASYNPSWAVKVPSTPSRPASVIFRQAAPPPPAPPRSLTTTDAHSASSIASGEARPMAPRGYADSSSVSSMGYAPPSRSFSWADGSSAASSEARPMAPMTYGAPSAEGSRA